MKNVFGQHGALIPGEGELIYYMLVLGRIGPDPFWCGLQRLLQRQ